MARVQRVTNTLTLAGVLSRRILDSVPLRSQINLHITGSEQNAKTAEMDLFNGDPTAALITQFSRITTINVFWFDRRFACVL